jgi:hypothetical protein
MAAFGASPSNIAGPEYAFDTVWLAKKWTALRAASVNIKFI